MCIRDRFTEAEQPIYYQFRAQGTAKTEILDICGLDGSTRVITAALIPKSKISEIFEMLEKTFEIRKKGKGIALTLPITGVQASMLNLLSAEQEKIAKAHIERKVPVSYTHLDVYKRQAVTSVMPADGPSFGIAPAGI